MTMATGDPAPPAAAAPPAEVVGRLRSAFESGRTGGLAWRRHQLRQLLLLLGDGEAELVDALHRDLGRSPFEGWLTDVAYVRTHVSHLLRHLDRWTRPERVRVPLLQRPARAWIVREPLGVALVIAPWNYPVQLLLIPMAGAIAAGNAVLGKPSELTPHTAAVLERLVARYLDPDAVTVLQGDAERTHALLEERFDHILYTGGGRVARLVMAAAARHLTPVTLELGGKSPAIVDRDADLAVAARRIAQARFLNAGQTCIAADHVLVHRDVEAALLDELAAAVRRFYGTDPRRSPDYGRIVSVEHTRRLARLLDAGGHAGIVVGGEVDEAERYVAPTVVRGVDPDSPLMAEEIFGPVLPVLPVPGMEAAVAFVRARPRPLALYLYTRSAQTRRLVAEGTSSGALSVNGGVLYAAVPDLPFGGVGDSGMGAYHGRQSIDTFSHRRSVLLRPARPDPAMAYPPYTRLRQALLRRLV